MSEAFLPRLDGEPPLVVDDTKAFVFSGQPLGRRVIPAYTLLGDRVLAVPLPVVDDPANVHLVVDDAAAALPVPSDRRVPPHFASRARDFLGIQGVCDCLGRFVLNIAVENETHDRALLGVDFALSPDAVAVGVVVSAQPISVRKPGDMFPFDEMRSLALAGLDANVLNHFRAQDGAQTNLEGIQRSLALSEMEFPLVVLKAFEDLFGVLDVSRQPVRRGADQDVCIATLEDCQRRLDLRPTMEICS
nr:hypothetical protein [uncultured Devosia sp.]